MISKRLDYDMNGSNWKGTGQTAQKHFFIQLYCKVHKFSEAKKLCCNPPKIQTKRPNLRVLCQNDANGIANSEDPDQTAPLGAV